MTATAHLHLFRALIGMGLLTSTALCALAECRHCNRAASVNCSFGSYPQFDVGESEFLTEKVLPQSQTIVRLEDTVGPSAVIKSSDLPQHFVPVGSCGNFDLHVVLVTPLAQMAIPGPASAIEILVDDRIDSIAAAEAAVIDFESQGRDASLEENLHWRIGSQSIGCLAPGKHTIQARTLVNGIWTNWSQPIRIEVQLPPTPQIVGLGNSLSGILPLSTAGIPEVNGRCIDVRLANAVQDCTYRVYVNGKFVKCSQLEQNCMLLNVPVSREAIVGGNTITIRAESSCQNSSSASNASPPVTFRYYYESFPFCELETQNHPQGSNVTPRPRSQNYESLPNGDQSLPADEKMPPNNPPADNDIDPQAKLRTQSIRRIGYRQQAPPKSENPSLTASDTPRQPAANPSAPNALAELPPNCESFVFLSPASFPIHHYGQRGELFEAEGVVIYEDMLVEWHCDGTYYVRMHTNWPPFPATMRMQLQVFVNGDWHTLTLPPRQLKSAADNLDSSGTQEVIYQGHSVVFGKPYPVEQLRRTGTVRLERIPETSY